MRYLYSLFLLVLSLLTTVSCKAATGLTNGSMFVMRAYVTNGNLVADSNTLYVITSMAAYVTNFVVTNTIGASNAVVVLGPSATNVLIASSAAYDGIGNLLIRNDNNASLIKDSSTLLAIQAQTALAAIGAAARLDLNNNVSGITGGTLGFSGSTLIQFDGGTHTRSTIRDGGFEYHVNSGASANDVIMDDTTFSVTSPALSLIGTNSVLVQSFNDAMPEITLYATNALAGAGVSVYMNTYGINLDADTIQHKSLHYNVWDGAAYQAGVTGTFPVYNDAVTSGQVTSLQFVNGVCVQVNVIP